MEPQTSIQVDKLTLLKFNEVRKSKSQSEYLKAMLDYFEATGINSTKPIFSVSAQLKAGIDKILKTIGKLERDKVNVILDRVSGPQIGSLSD